MGGTCSKTTDQYVRREDDKLNRSAYHDDDGEDRSNTPKHSQQNSYYNTPLQPPPQAQCTQPNTNYSPPSPFQTPQRHAPSSGMCSSYLNFQSFALSPDNTYDIDFNEQSQDLETLLKNNDQDESSASSEEEDPLSSTRHMEELINMHAEAKRLRRYRPSLSVAWDKPIKNRRGSLTPAFEINDSDSHTHSPGINDNIYGGISTTDLMHSFNKYYNPPVVPKAKDELEFLKRVLMENFIFGGLTPGEQTLFVLAMERFHCAPNTVLMREGTPPGDDYFYILKKGRVTILKDGQKLSHGKPGSCFGELSLLYNAPRAVTIVVANRPAQLFRLDRKSFRSLLANSYRQSSQSTLQVLRRVEIFKHLQDNILIKIAALLTVVEKQKGKFIVRKGEPGQVFYIIQQGRVKVTNAGLGDAKYMDQILGPGDFFGERALLTGEPRAADVVAVENVTLLALDKTTSEKMVGDLSALLDTALDKRKLCGIPALAEANLEPYEYEKLMSRMIHVEFAAGQILTTEGMPLPSILEPGIYLIKQGRISQTASKGRSVQLNAGDYFGQSFLHANVQTYRAHSTTKVLEHAVCKRLTAVDISRALGGLERLSRKTSVAAYDQDPTLNLENLEYKTLVGAGTFGQVWLTCDRRDQACYALKCQIKRDLISKRQVKGVLREKNLMATIHHPYILRLLNAFQDSTRIYMVVNALQGGELFSLIHTPEQDGIPEEAARFYSANIYEALLYLHDRFILYRDLKPENVLLDSDGYCVLIDLGFAKVVTDKTYTLCGTPLYLAPEIVLSRGYDKGVDNWSFAALIYEMLMGYSPFYTKNITQMMLFKRIVRADYSFPEWADCSDTAIDLIARLLVLNPNHRLGALAGGDNDIREHPWLASISAADLMTKSISVPWIPEISNAFGGDNFQNWEHLQRKLESRNPQELELTAAEQEMFAEFSD